MKKVDGLVYQSGVVKIPADVVSFAMEKHGVRKDMKYDYFSCSDDPDAVVIRLR